VVVTTAGPFDRYGTPVVALCAKYGTSYCDITGETNWVREMIDKYDDVAKKTGGHPSLLPSSATPCSASSLLPLFFLLFPELLPFLAGYVASPPCFLFSFFSKNLFNFCLGARIVHFCGNDCIPWDLTVYVC
jgi:hypothetical protein